VPRWRRKLVPDAPPDGRVSNVKRLLQTLAATEHLAGPVTITRADGATEVRPPYTLDEVWAIQGGGSASDEEEP
jgi:hypothetical protein